MATLTLELSEPLLKRIEISARSHGHTLEEEAAELLESVIKVQDALDKANEKAAADALEIEDLKTAMAEIKKYAPGFLDRMAASVTKLKAERDAAKADMLAEFKKLGLLGSKVSVNPIPTADRDQLALELDASQGELTGNHGRGRDEVG